MPDINREHLKSPNPIFDKGTILLQRVQTFGVPDSWAPLRNTRRLAATKQSGDDLARQPSRKIGFTVTGEQRRPRRAQGLPNQNRCRSGAMRKPLRLGATPNRIVRHKRSAVPR
jgi:hypothetical protein